MLSLALISFFAGILTILAPCVLPVLPVILAGSLGEKGKWYPYIVTASLAVSIVFFTIILKATSLLINVHPDFWKYLSGLILLALGLIYIFPHAWTKISSKLFGSNANSTLNQAQNIEGSTLRAIVTGGVLGPVFSTCSPTYSLLLATIFPVSLISGVIYTLIYALGLSLMLLLISKFGSKLIRKLGVYADEKGTFRKILGIILLVVGLLIITGIDKKIERIFIEAFDVSTIEQGVLDRFIPVANPTLPSLNPNSEMSGSINLNVTNPSQAPEFPKDLTQWINSNPLTMAGLKGKVVVIDFWTYSCINCVRTLPYLTAWDSKYRDQGLVIIGVHAPEFAFEKLKNNVEKAVKTANIAYPVVLDNDFALWNEYANRYWPAKYFIDRSGKLRHTHFGEGAYAESEKVIQYLLSEGQKNLTIATGSVKEAMISKESPNYELSPETYLGTERRANNIPFGQQLSPSQWSLKGNWNEEGQSITSLKKSILRYNFSARDVYLVLSGTGSVGITVNGKMQHPGKDVTGGIISVDTDRMYHIVHAGEFIDNAILELAFSGAVTAYAFTFGS